MSFKFLHVTDQTTLNKVYRFRYKVWCEESNILDRSNYPDQQESDQYDDYADHFAIFDEHDEVCACIRLIHHSPIGYPTANYLEYDHEKYVFKDKRMAELSRIFVDSSHRSIKQTKLFFTGFTKYLVYPKLKEYKIDYCYGALEKQFLKLLNIYKIPYRSIGNAKFYYGGNRHPSVMSVKELEECNPELTAEHKSQKNHLHS